MASGPDIFQLQEQELKTLLTRMEDLRRRYDFYFLGLEKREPGFYREQLEKDIRTCRLNAALQSATRFRYKNFLARYRMYAEKWDRTLREMEAGTYKRGAVTQAERHAASLAQSAMNRAEGVDPATGKPLDGAPDDAEDGSLEERRIRAASRRAQALLAGMLRKDGPGPPRPAPAGGAGNDVQQLYNAYVGAKQSRGEDVSKISLARFAKSVRKQEQMARQKLGTDVRLRVKVAGDKVTLVANRQRKKEAE